MKESVVGSQQAGSHTSKTLEVRPAVMVSGKRGCPTLRGFGRVRSKNSTSADYNSLCDTNSRYARLACCSGVLNHPGVLARDPSARRTMAFTTALALSRAHSHVGGNVDRHGRHYMAVAARAILCLRARVDSSSNFLRRGIRAVQNRWQEFQRSATGRAPRTRAWPS